MLKRLKPHQVTLGMFVQRFEGGWMSHPFWRAGFLLENPDDLQKIRMSKIEAVWVVHEDGDAPAPRQRILRTIPRGDEDTLAFKIRAARITASAMRPVPTKLQEDKVAAAQTVARSKQIVKLAFANARLGRTVRSADVISVVKDISESLTRNKSMLIGITRLKSKDEYTFLHSVAVCALMVNLAREIGMDEKATRDIGMAGLLHDVGKMTIAEDILNKPASLTPDEFTEIQRHTTRGHALLSSGNGIPSAALDVCLNHHEKMDGTGYPHGLRDSAISLPARMGAICDVYDAMTSRRSYKAPCTPAETIAAMHSWKGHFDSGLLFSFMRSLDLFPAGMLVRLKSGNLGVVLPNRRRVSRVKVRIFYDLAGSQFIKPVDIILTDSPDDDQILSEESPETWGLKNWPSMLDELLSDRSPRAEAA